MHHPYLRTSNVTLYLGDTREVLPGLPAESAHVLLTDPPYGMAYVSWAGERILGDGKGEALPLLEAMLPEVDRVLVKPAHAYVFCHYASYPGFFQAINPIWPVKSGIVWWKAQGGAGDTGASYARDYELALFCHVGGRRLLTGKREGSVWKVPPVPPRRRIHPTQKPVELLRRLIVKSSEPGEVVLDPFGGSAATAEAALLEGRRAVLVELDERHCEAAAQRVEALEGRIREWGRP